ncbi:solute carrier family 52, riboflavin transporter, member 3-A-like [Apis laboriosa]|uniref:solute carrier family 52, riboflavin transporter, member 3-A-like n=1 Tax=Apis laboriosa TaxID=183418 RepID=UPI001CC630D7|nr:solute carrier family 52, riboflavin transporter, member 3-A-like [Apis laboriosa]
MIHITQDKKICNEKTYIVVHFLIILFGISSWIGINGIFIQIPVLINTSPEGWLLPVYLVSVTQTANFGPLLYIILQYFKCKINEPWWIMCLLVLGTLAMGFLSFFHSEKTVIADDEYSLLLFVLTFFNALVGCFSSILFIPYLRNFNIKFLTSYFIGEGLSSVLPSIIALIQGIGYISECIIFKNNTNIESLESFVLKFSPSEYFLFIFIILFLSLVAFAILEYSSVFQNIKQIHNSINIVLGEKQAYDSHDHCTNNIQEMKHYLVNNSKYLTKQTRNYLFILLAIFCFLSHGFFPSIQSYSCLPYGSIAYKLSIICAQVANPLMCLLAFWFKISSIKIINYLSVICLFIGSYVIYLAMSSSPPLQATKLGIFLVIISWALLIGFVSYLKLIVISVFRNTVLPNILFNVGAIMQIASTSGAIFSFIIINFTNYFKVHDNCA